MDSLAATGDVELQLTPLVPAPLATQQGFQRCGLIKRFATADGDPIQTFGAYILSSGQQIVHTHGLAFVLRPGVA